MDIDGLRNLAEVVALFSAATFFGYKLLTGYFLLNLSVVVACHRQRSAEANLDTLVVITTLEKGSEGSLELHDAQAKITVDGRTEYFDFPGTRRSAYVDRSDAFATGKSARINWNESHPDSPFIKMTPNERTELALYCSVPSGGVCAIEVAIAGRKTFRSSNLLSRIFKSPKMGQWKACSVSLPIVDV